jgi:hypothetical protein
MKNICVKESVSKLVHNPGLKRYLGSLRYCLYVIFHPFDGFWDLKNEKRGTLAGANTIVLLTLLTRLWIKQFSGFLFVNVNWEQVNIWSEMAMIFLPLIIWCVSNWCLTTLFDGLGSLKDVYIATGYALTPYPLIQIPMILMSNVITADEGALYVFFGALSIVWCVALLLVGLMQTHDYTMGKTVLAVFASLVGMLVIIVLCLLIFSMTSEAIAYFVSLVREMIIRFG